MYHKCVPLIISGLVFSCHANCQSATTMKSGLPKQVNPVEVTDTRLHMNPEQQAAFPGGVAAWNKFVRDSVNKNILLSKKAPPGQYTVTVRFIVSYWGGISDVVAETHHGYGLEEEAIRLIKKSPRWLPARQAGRPVNAYCKQPVTLTVSAQ
jgi:protein TonB